MTRDVLHSAAALRMLYTIAKLSFTRVHCKRQKVFHFYFCDNFYECTPVSLILSLVHLDVDLQDFGGHSC